MAFPFGVDSVDTAFVRLGGGFLLCVRWPSHIPPENPAIGETIDDDKSFGAANYEDGDGNRYAVASTVATLGFPTVAGMPLADVVSGRRWLHDEAGTLLVDLAKAQAAQAALVVWSPSTDENGSQVLGARASPSALTAVIHNDPSQALEWLGLTKI